MVLRLGKMGCPAKGFPSVLGGRDEFASSITFDNCWRIRLERLEPLIRLSCAPHLAHISAN
jgi:hypothetical protein